MRKYLCVWWSLFLVDFISNGPRVLPIFRPVLWLVSGSFVGRFSIFDWKLFINLILKLFCTNALQILQLPLHNVQTKFLALLTAAHPEIWNKKFLLVFYLFLFANFSCYFYFSKITIFNKIILINFLIFYI
jgi:hypothetical protein